MLNATINSISHSCPVCHGTFFNVLIDKFYSCKHRDIIIFAHNYFKNKTQTKQHFVLCITIEYIFLLIEIRYFILLAINTHIYCSNNSKCSVRCIFKATAKSLESVSSSIFCYVPPIRVLCPFSFVCVSLESECFIWGLTSPPVVAPLPSLGHTPGIVHKEISHLHQEN